MGYRDDEATVREYKDKLFQSQSPGAYLDAIIIAKQQGAKTNKQIEKQANLIAHNRSVDAQKNLTRAEMHTANMELLKGTQPDHHVTDSKNHTKTIKGD